MIDVILDAVIDSIKLLPFLYLTYLLMEYMEHKMNKKTRAMIQKSGKIGPLYGALLGIFPQCGFSAAASGFYAGGVITIGTLLAVFLSTSDEMLPILLTEAVAFKTIGRILILKLVFAMIAGFAADYIFRKRGIANKAQHKDIHDLCEKEHCHCEENGNIWIAALKHTMQVLLFIFIITLVLNLLFYLGGEEVLKKLSLTSPVMGEIVAGLIGMVPNCGASVVLTQLYLKGLLSGGALMAGLFNAAGIGLLVLYRVNSPMRQNVKITILLYGTGVICGLIIHFCEILCGIRL